MGADGQADVGYRSAAGVRPLPDPDEQAEAMAVVNAFGSDEIRQSFNSWRDLIWDMIWAVAEIDREQRPGGSRRENSDDELYDGSEPYNRLSKLHPAKEEARQALARQIRAELQAARVLESRSIGDMWTFGEGPS